MSIDSEAMVWFLMRAAYGQEQKAQEFLEAKGIETFLPLQEHCFVRDGKNGFYPIATKYDNEKANRMLSISYSWASPKDIKFLRSFK